MIHLAMRRTSPDPNPQNRTLQAGGSGSSPYGDPAVYDILMSPGTASEIGGLERLVARWIRGASSPTSRARRTLVWLEPGCGTGRYLRVLAARGHRVIGFDHAPGMVDFARTVIRRHGLGRRARVLLAPMTAFATRVGSASVDFAFNLHNTIRHLDSDAAMLAHFAEVARVLRVGGLYAVGISLSRYGHEAVEEDVWIGRRGHCTVRQLVQYLPPGTPEHGPGRRRFERVVSHLAIERPASVQHLDSTYELRCYDARQWGRLLERSALQRVAIVDWRGSPLAECVTPYAIELLVKCSRRR